MGANPWDPTAPMPPAGAPAGQRAPGAPGAPPRRPGQPHWPTPQQGLAPPPAATASSARLRLWAPALALYLLAPVAAEALTGSTPPLQFFSPVFLLYLTGLYGSGALLARETVRRRGLGWGSLILLGAAYGALEEGLVVTSWTNPYWPAVLSLQGYSRFLGVNWFWALGMTAFHAIISVALPIIVVETLFPAVASRPWLGGRAYRALMGWLALVSVLGLVTFGFLQFRDQGYHPQPLGWLAALLIAAALVWLALHPLKRALRHARNEPTLPPPVTARPAPSLAALRFAGFGFTAFYFAAFWAGPSIFKRPLIGEAVLAGVLLLPAIIVTRWSRCLDWNPRRRLALATGATLALIALAPIIEFGVHTTTKDETGLWLVAVAALAGLIWLARRARLNEVRRLGAPTP